MPNDRTAAPPHPQIEKLLRVLRAGAPKSWDAASASARRASFDGLARFAGAPPPGVGARDFDIESRGGPLPVRLYAPDGLAEPSSGLVFFHGGGLVAGSLATHDVLCRRLAAGLRVRLLAVDYRLAPEHPYPSAIEDALDAARFALDGAAALGMDPERVAIGGDSAGATLAAIVTQRLRDAGDRRLKAQLMLCPVLDVAGERPSKRLYGDGFLLDAPMMARDLAHYAPTVPVDHPSVSPLRAADLRGLPRAAIHTAECDPLCDEGLAYAEALRRAGIPVSHTCHAGMVHGFYGLGGVASAAAAALERIVADFAAVLHGRAEQPA